ncbi:MAG: RNA polymerase sigma factor (TIGR02999 family) [Planctomycetota bacterium]|jgi:RNA polymerase sigma factor (TIGR02999 family)
MIHGMIDPPSEASARAVTRILGAAVANDPSASHELLPLVYADLRNLAAARMARLAPGQTLQATALVHEAYMRLVGTTDPGWQGRAHFFGAAARAMRNIVADHLQRKGSFKRGGHLRRVSQDTAAELICDGASDDVLAVEEALAMFEREYPRKAEVVTLSFYSGLDTEEIAEVLGLSARTVERDWRFAKAWLNSRLTEEDKT